MAKKAEITFIRVTQNRSLIGEPMASRQIVKGLGLRRIRHSVELRDTPAVRGMVEKVQHLVSVEVRNGEAALFGLRHR